jgi:hypothetical protein
LPAPVADTTHRDAVAAPRVIAFDLHGTLQATLTSTVRGPIDAGLQYGVTGWGDLSGLPRFTASGFVRRTGYIFRGHASGELTLTNAKGSITLSLEGPVQPGFAPLPNRFHFTVTGGSGAYKGLIDDGVVTLRAYPQGMKTVFGLSFT